MPVENVNWYGIRVKLRSELRSHEELRLRGFEPFLPLRAVRRRWSDRMKTVEVPVFPGYLFCRFLQPDRLRVLNAPGVVQVIGAGNRPIPISEAEIGSIQTLVASKLALRPWPYIAWVNACESTRGRWLAWMPSSSAARMEGPGPSFP
jgi:transcription antitermination factor NusG